MHHSSSRFCIAPRSLIIRGNIPFYVWYITSLCWNIRWKTCPHVNILLIGVSISVETVLVLIHSFSVAEYQIKHSAHVSYMSCLCFGILQEILPFVLNIFLVSVVKSHTKNIYYSLVFRYQTKLPFSSLILNFTAPNER